MALDHIYGCMGTLDFRKSPCSYFIRPAGRITAVTTNTRPAVKWTSINRLARFSRVGQEN